MNSINSDSEKDAITYKHVLEESTTDLNPVINARLNASRREALSLLEPKQTNGLMSLIWRPAIALLIPVMAVTMFSLNTLNEESPETDLYSDIELLIDEEQFDFLIELDISEWQDIES